jgi:hypothetical protein
LQFTIYYQVIGFSTFCVGVKGDPGATSPATAGTPYPTVPSGPTPQQLLQDLQLQLHKLFAAKAPEKISNNMGIIQFIK